MTAKEQGLPELPASYGEHCVYDSVRVMRRPGYTADQMHAYALAALASDTGERGVVAAGAIDSLRHFAKLLRERGHCSPEAMDGIADNLTAALRAQPAGGGTSLTDAGLDRQMQNAVARHDALPDYLKATPPAQAAEAVERVRCALWENRTGTYDAMARAAIAAMQAGE